MHSVVAVSIILASSVTIFSGKGYFPRNKTGTTDQFPLKRTITFSTNIQFISPNRDVDRNDRVPISLNTGYKLRNLNRINTNQTSSSGMVTSLIYLISEPAEINVNRVKTEMSDGLHSGNYIDVNNLCPPTL